MKAAQVTRFGEPDVLRINDVDRPVPGADDVLVSVEATSVNGHDVLVRAGKVKLLSGCRFPIGVGLDFAGTVAEAGSGVQGYRAGDRVWGTVHPRKRRVTGAAAEYVTVPANRIARTPPNVSSSEAASLAVAGATALIALRDSVGLKSGERVLVRGAAGGVGTAAVQLAKAMGGRVTALARDRYADALTDLGAQQVIDYRKVSAGQTGPFDVIIDMVGSDLASYRRRLTPDGRMVTVGLSAGTLIAIAVSSIHGSRRIRTFSANPDTGLLSDVATYVASGALRPVVHGAYPLTDIAAAQQAFSEGGVLGKQVVTVS